MRLFKNKVGRPSNETIKQRKMFYIGTVVLVIAVMVVSGYLIISKFNGGLSSSNKNATAVPNKPTIKMYYEKVKGINYKSGKLTNKKIIVVANSNSYGRKYYEYVITGAMKKTGKGSQVTISKFGTSYIKFRACFSSNKKCSAYTSNQKIKIENIKPNLKVNLNIKSNGKGTMNAICSDSNNIELWDCHYNKTSSNKNAQVICEHYTTNNSYNKRSKTLTRKVKRVNNNKKAVGFVCQDKAGNYSIKTFTGYVFIK